MRLRELFQSREVEEASGDLDQTITQLTYDSRRVTRGSVFFAITGEKLDGSEFIPQAFENGAAAVVATRAGRPPAGGAWIRVENVRRAMGIWGARYFGRPAERLSLVGVTGTNGKTTVTYLLESMFAAAGLEPGVVGTINYRFGGRRCPAHHTTPESLDLQGLLAEMIGAGTQAVAMEVSSHALAQERVRGIDFDVGVFTNLTRDHLDYHGDMETYFAAKARLFTEFLRTSGKKNRRAVIHGADPWGAELLKRTQAVGIPVLSYGREGSWDVRPAGVQSRMEGLRGEIRLKDQTLEFASPLIGAANLENVLGAAAAAFALGLPLSAIRQGIEHLRVVPGRLEKIENQRGFTVLVDYAHTPDALEKVLQAIRPLAGTGRICTVFGCGGDRDRGKRPLMGEIAARLSDFVWLTSDNPRTEDPERIISEIVPGVEKGGMRKTEAKTALTGSPGVDRGYGTEPDRRAAIQAALAWVRPGDILLIAGKGHEDYQILGDRKIHFDDREVVREELGRMAAA